MAVIRAECDAPDTLTDTGEGVANGAHTVAAPHLFVALECARPAAGASRHSLAQVGRVVLARTAARCAERSFEGAARALLVGVPDPRISSRHAQLVREEDEFFVEDLGSRNGTRLNGAPVSGRVPLSDGDLLEAGHTLFRYRAAFPVPIGAPLDVDSTSDPSAELLRTLDPALAQRAGVLGRIARSRNPILILGETGTGKEVLARGIHRVSQRRGAFVAVNCGALPAALLEAQLFGHVRGAFSGALTDSPGLLRAADGGTLLLDEIGDLPEASQAALLRALQEQEVVPVGGVRPIKVDLRVVAATHRPLAELVAHGEFRRDLFARLAGFAFTIPPLRDRPDDLGILVGAFASDRSLRLTLAAGRALFEYPWPLNVRELVHTLDVAATVAGDEPVDMKHLPALVAKAAAPAASGGPPREPADRLRKRLVASLSRHHGNITDVARELGKARMQVHRWMKRFGIDPSAFR